ncbi:MAG: S9 family peptidase [Clostridia bacterium]|nr:S9 family peptidase [Clostridia bacterium]
MSKRLMTLEDCIGIERLNGGDWHAEKGLVCWASNHTGGVMVKNLKTGAETKYTARGGGEGYARFSPDGKYVSFLSSLPGKGRQVCIADLASGEVKALTSIAGAAMEPLWNPDGKHILFSSSQETADHTDAPSDEPVVIEDFHYKVDGAGFIRPDGHVQLFLADAETGETRQLTQGESDWMHPCFSPDGRYIAAVGNQNRPKEESIGYDLFVMDLQAEDPQFRQISQDLIMVSYPNPIRPVFMPDGQSIIMGVLDPLADPALGYPPAVLYSFSIGGGEPVRLFQADAGCFQCVQFPYNAFCGNGLDKVQLDPDTGSVYFVSGWQGQANLYCLKPGDLHAHPVRVGKRVIHGLSRIQQGKMMIAEGLTDRPEAYILIDLNEPEAGETLVQSASEVLAECEITRTEDFFFATLDGESRVHGFVTHPARQEKGKKYPAVLYVHGGPHPFYTYGFTAEFQAWAARGYAVLWCNPRGSSGYGSRHQNYVRSVDGSAYTDILQFTDEALRRFDWIDENRLGVTGGSYGGYMTNWIASHAKRFRAYITQRSVVSDLIGYASSDMQGDSKKYPNFEEFMVNALRTSPVSYAENIDRPFLILHGEDDLRCPVEGAHQLFTAIKDTHPDLPVRMVIFPQTPHDQPRNPTLLRRYYQEMYDWFDRFLI